MGALRAAQFEYDNRLPSAVSETPQEHAERIWIENNVEQLMLGSDATFKIGGMSFGITFEAFAEAIDERAMSELGREGISKSVLGRLIWAGARRNASDGQAATVEIMAVPDLKKLLEQIAHDLLVPFALSGTQAEAAEVREP